MRFTLALGAFLGLAVIASCGADGDGNTPPDASAATDAAPAASWTNYAADFFVTYCHACHGPGDSSRDYSVLTMVRAETGKIRCGVSATALSGCSISAKQFPIGDGPKPSDDERAKLVRWLDDGAIE